MQNVLAWFCLIAAAWSVALEHHCSCLQVARSLKDEVAIYYPHNLDFRGRAYTIHPHLNHLGADNVRGLLVFSTAKPLGRDGLRWLRIQASNLYGNGVDKLSLEGRDNFLKDNIDRVLDCANAPLDGSRWWLEAEDPWQACGPVLIYQYASLGSQALPLPQFLATCFELRDALKARDPSEFMSQLPCHQARRPRAFIALLGSLPYI